jgi:hypothetical protein
LPYGGKPSGSIFSNLSRKKSREQQLAGTSEGLDLALERENPIEKRCGPFAEHAYQFLRWFHNLHISQQDLADVLLSRAEAKTDDALPIQKQC